DQTSLGQFSGRVQQTYKHSVPRFFVPEHGTMFTLALVRFPPTATKEIQYLNAKGALTYTDIAGVFLMSSLMLLLVWLIFFMVLIKLLPILGTISGKTVKLMVLALICLGNNRQD